MNASWQQLKRTLEGEVHRDHLHKTMYATDGSIYRQLPAGVAYPKTPRDIHLLIRFASDRAVPLIPRTAGTSLAGQCVGSGLVVDVSRYMNRILEFNEKERWVRIQPGVIREELNQYLAPYGLWFSPNTSTSNRCMLGGMAGNNSSGTTSIKYGVTRDKVLKIKALLSDGSSVVFEPLSRNGFMEKCQLDTLEGRLYRQIHKTLNRPDIQAAIKKHFPKPEIHRRNTGYAVDALMQMVPFRESGAAFNFCKMLCGSEGTLAFTTELVLQLDELPPPAEVLVCAHFKTLRESMQATLAAMHFEPYSCELMDKTILDCTKHNREQQKNRFFIAGDPGAILFIELRGETLAQALEAADELTAALQAQGYGYAFPKVFPPDTKKVWSLRAAGFGVLSNIQGEKKPVEFVEDTAVALADLPAYINEFDKLIKDFGTSTVYYAHAGAGELHTRPMINLKSKKGVAHLRAIAMASARLVKKYRGSLSGEHGDGRVRGEFVREMVGEMNYELFCQIKHTWDPQRIFNPGKIVEAPPMEADLRYRQDTDISLPETVFDFSESGNILSLAEKCNGSGDCRKLAEVSGGVMCPSYMATRQEKDTTRARANVLREFLSRPSGAKNPFDRQEIKEVMDLCISCKGCASECPSNVDMAIMKAEFLHQYHKSNGVPLRDWMFGNIATINHLASFLPGFSNFIFKNKWTARWLKKLLGVAPGRSFPALSKTPFSKWYKMEKATIDRHAEYHSKVFLFADEFTEYNDAGIGQKAVLLLAALGYEVEVIGHAESGRAAISKGLLDKARKLAVDNVAAFSGLVSQHQPLLGIEPSAILSFRDEYPKLVNAAMRKQARQLSTHTYLVEEFLYREFKKGKISAGAFSTEKQKVYIHGHCHQKALSDADTTAWSLSIPENYSVEIIPAGCCGMAGSFGYEAEHFEISMQIGELVLFPKISTIEADAILVANGTSCRHQILDGTGRAALHPVEVLYGALNSK